MDIKNITGMNEINKVHKTDKTKNIAKTDKTKRTDSVEISSKARRSVEVQKYIDIVKNSSDIRKDKIDSAKQKLKNGDYNKPEVYDKIAEKLMMNFKIGDKILNKLGDDGK